MPIDKNVELLQPTFDTNISLPYADGGVRAGLPTPVQDSIDQTLDLNRDLIDHPAATFYARVVGDSMEPDMFSGDLLLIDRAIEPYDGCLAICALDGEFTVKELDLTDSQKGVIHLVPHNPKYAVIDVEECRQFEVWGVVKYIIHDLYKNR